MQVVFNLRAHKNLVGTLRKAYIFIGFLDPSPNMLNQNLSLGIYLKTGAWNAASLAVVQPAFGEPLH